MGTALIQQTFGKEIKILKQIKAKVEKKGANFNDFLNVFKKSKLEDTQYITKDIAKNLDKRSNKIDKEIKKGKYKAFNTTDVEKMMNDLLK